MYSQYINTSICVVILFVFVMAYGKIKASGAVAQLKKGIRALEDGNPLYAVRMLQEAGGELSGDPEYWYYLALALEGGGSRKDALMAARRVCALCPHNPRAMALLEYLQEPDG